MYVTFRNWLELPFKCWSSLFTEGESCRPVSSASLMTSWTNAFRLFSSSSNSLSSSSCRSRFASSYCFNSLRFSASFLISASFSWFCFSKFCTASWTWSCDDCVAISSRYCCSSSGASCREGKNIITLFYVHGCQGLFSSQKKRKG